MKITDIFVAVSNALVNSIFGPFFGFIYQFFLRSKIIWILGFVWTAIRSVLFLYGQLANKFAELVQILIYHGAETSSYASLMNSASSLMAVVNYVFPLSEMVALVVALGALRLSLLPIKYFRAIWRDIPFKAS